MFRSLIKENTTELKSISKSVQKINKFQKGVDKEIKKLLGQKIGEVKKTLPSVRTKVDECMKSVGDPEMCGIVIGKYNKFYNEVCQATPAICDDYHIPVARELPPRTEPVESLKKTRENIPRI